MIELETQSESSRVYLRLKKLFGASRTSRKAKRDSESSEPYGLGREPKGVAEVLTGLATELGWNQTLAQSEILDSWPEIVGPDLAAHSSAISIQEGVLTVGCDSTAWATQLRLLREELLSRILETQPESGITQLRFRGPDVPSWKRGLRSTPGRGPRDTYG